MCAASPTSPGRSTGWREKVRPTPPLQWHFREKVLPARPLRRLFREKVLPARTKTPNLGCCERAGRIFSRFHDLPATQGELFRACRRRPSGALPISDPSPTGVEGAVGSGGPGPSARGRRQGAAIARQLARGPRLGKTLFAQQQPHRAPPVQNPPSTPTLATYPVQNSPGTPTLTTYPVQNSPSTPTLATYPVQNSPRTPEMAQFGTFYARRESFVPLSPPRSRAGRVLYRTRGRDRASHDSTTGPTSVEGTGGAEGGGGTGRYRRVRGDRRARAGFEARGLTAAPAGRARAWSRQISHAIPPRHESTRAQKPRNIND